jgi:predicted dehydrogenase
MAIFDGNGEPIAASGISRRRLIGSAFGLGVGALASSAFGAPRKLAPSDRVNIAVIGCGGQGASNMSKLTGQNIVATADADYDHVLAALTNSKTGKISRPALKEAYDKAERFTDYRKMLDSRKDIDAVLIATPDHHHAPAAHRAMERGYHVFVQKPLTYSIEESRKLAELAKANPSLVTQMGNQGHSGDDGRRVIELIRGGAIGRVSEVHVWTNRPVWPQGVPRPAAVPAPASLDWQVWLGPANVDWGYNPDYAHFNWRGWTPFGSGALGDMGAHLVDFPFWSLDPGLPTKVETRHSRWAGNKSLWDTKRPAEITSYPLASITRYEFGNGKNAWIKPGAPLHMTWYDGGLLPPTPPGFPDTMSMSGDGGVLFIGEHGMLMHETYGEKPVLIGEGTDERAKKIPISLPRIQGGIGGHENNWIRAIRGEEKISCPFEYATRLNETMNLGVVALQADHFIEYDATKMAVTNIADANRYLRRQYRPGWEL